MRSPNAANCRTSSPGGGSRWADRLMSSCDTPAASSNPRRVEVRDAATAAVRGVGDYPYNYAEPLLFAPDARQLVGFNDNNLLQWSSTASGQLPNASAENYLQNQVKVLESETLARRVARKLPPPPRQPAPALTPFSTVQLTAKNRRRLHPIW